MSEKDLSNKSKEYLEKKIKDTNATINLFNEIGEDTTILKEDLDIYKAVLASKKTHKKRKKLDDKTKRILEISRSTEGLEYDETDDEKVRNNKIKTLQKRQDELQRIDREILRPLADEESNPESSEHWSEMEQNASIWDELQSIKEKIEKKDKRGSKIKRLMDMISSNHTRNLQELNDSYKIATTMLFNSDGNLDKAVDKMFNLRSAASKKDKSSKKKKGKSTKKGKKKPTTKKKGKKKPKKQKGGRYKTKKKSKSKRKY